MSASDHLSELAEWAQLAVDDAARLVIPPDELEVLKAAWRKHARETLGDAEYLAQRADRLADLCRIKGENTPVGVGLISEHRRKWRYDVRSSALRALAIIRRDPSQREEMKRLTALLRQTYIELLAQLRRDAAAFLGIEVKP